MRRELRLKTPDLTKFHQVASQKTGLTKFHRHPLGLDRPQALIFV
jgi:hypothetical protein